MIDVHATQTLLLDECQECLSNEVEVENKSVEDEEWSSKVWEMEFLRKKKSKRDEVIRTCLGWIIKYHISNVGWIIKYHISNARWEEKVKKVFGVMWIE